MVLLLSLNGESKFGRGLLRDDLVLIGLDIVGGGLGIGALLVSGGRFLSILLFETV